MKKLNGVKTQFSRKYSDVEINKSPGFRAFSCNRYQKQL